MTDQVAVIFGAGPGLGASLARTLAGAGMKVVIAARTRDKTEAIAQATGARAMVCDVSVPEEVDRVIAEVARELGAPALVVHNASARVRGPVVDLEPAAVERALKVSALGGFHVGRAAARAMLPRGAGSIFFTGATASVKGFALSASFAMGKFALRGLAQSMARELAPKGIHVAHVVIDGGIGGAGATGPDDRTLDPDAIAESYLALHRQHRSAWTWEIELRPWVEKF
jgi:NAD(P)-dependent dehydrogenase (short-subunit alcohol dehydrogenase family)